MNKMTDLLNDAQRNGLTATLMVVEEIIEELENILNEKAGSGVILDVEDDIPKAKKEEIALKFDPMREQIKKIKDIFDLEKKNKLNSRIFSGRLTYCWSILTGSKAKGLRGYGEVAEGLESILDPQLDILIGLINEIEGILKRD